jgi:uncharacterized membrane protein YhaH (DUF805 family)
MEEYLKVIKEHYADFDGRARRKEYWMFALINMIISIVLTFGGRSIGAEWIGSLYSLAVLVPGIAVAVRRLHDIGKSGWWLLIALIPLVGAIWLIVLLATDGTKEDNEYGASPKYGSNEFDELGNN